MTSDRYRCPDCSGTFDFHVKRNGQQGCCPHCGEPVRGRTRDPGQDSLIPDGGTDDRGREAEWFWEKYDIPFEFGTAIKLRSSGLSRGSWGDGRARDTVVHLHVQESFRDGRLSRSEGAYLCEPGSRVMPNAEESPIRDGLEQKVTCETCKERMERWRIPPEELLAETNSGNGRDVGTASDRSGGPP